LLVDAESHKRCSGVERVLRTVAHLVAITCALKHWRYHKRFDGSAHLSSTPAGDAQSLTSSCAWQASQLAFPTIGSAISP
jgi:hypothetical protein